MTGAEIGSRVRRWLRLRPKTDPEPVADADSAYQAIVIMLHRKAGGRDSRVHPEVRKVLERILDHLIALSAQPADADQNQAMRTKVVNDAIQGHPWLATARFPSEEQGWALADALAAAWIRTAPEQDLEVEWSRFKEHAPRDPTPETKRAWLLRTYVDRQRAGAHDRARGALRSKYLRNAGLMLAALVGGTWVVAVVFDVTSGDAVLTLCALSGALGGTLSGARALRDVSRLADARAFQTWWWVQPLVGAAIGMFLYALLASAVITLPGSESPDPQEQAAARIVYAFIAGFSEPFLLRVMDSLAGVAQRAAPAPVPPSPMDATREDPSL
jgi:hypothetical protein